MDERCYRLAVHPGQQDGLAYLGWEVPNARALQEAFAELEAAGVEPRQGTPDECRDRRVRGLVRCADPLGYPLEFFYGQEIVSRPFHPTRPISGFVAGELGLGHVVLCAPDIGAAAFYTDVLGFRVSDYWGDRMVFLHCNPRHHSLGFGTIGGSFGLTHIMIEARSLDDVGTTLDLCQERGIPIDMGFGRHSNDLMYSFYMESPSGFRVEYGWNGRLVDDATWSVKQLDRASIWGHRRADQAGSVASSRPVGT
jgi:2,3-dihydroxybiphenyl 1,2-dioxygenase